MKKSLKKIKILFDTREQKPWKFDGFLEYIDVSKETLPFADYTVVGHDMFNDDNSIIIERKKDTLELIGNIGRHWDRFKSELEGMSRYKYKQIVVCNPCNIEYLFGAGLTMINPPFFYRQIAFIYSQYNIPVLFFSNDSQAEQYVSRLFYQIVNKTWAES